jgi:hypothetical protein
MRKDWKYIVYLLLAVGIYLFVKLTAPREYDWTITYHREDKNPFGGYALSRLASAVFPNDTIIQSNNTPYEILDSLDTPINFLSISTTFAPGNDDMRALLKNVASGGNALIAAQHFYGPFADTLELYTSDYLFDQMWEGAFAKDDSSQIFFTNPALPQNPFSYPRKNIHNYFENFDSTFTSVVAVNDLDMPVLLRMKWGKGSLFVCSTPLVFTNAYMLPQNNTQFAESVLSLLPNQTTHWSEYYHLGKMQIQTPLRFILGTESLRWAYYLTIGGLLIFILFEMKRKQRIIPIMKPLENTTLEFVGTIGNLYFQSKDHKSIAEKRIVFLLEQIRTRYGFHLQHRTEESLASLARRSGNSLEKTRELMNRMERIQAQKTITEQELKDLNTQIENFIY